jgi:hypothetical protein
MEENPQCVAQEVVRESLAYVNDDDANVHHDKEVIASLAPSLTESLISYRDFCTTHLLRRRYDGQQLKNIKFKCRLVASVGPSGAKCPQFHIDHVTVRWIQTFVGPGVVLVDGEAGIRWDAFLGESDGGDDDDEDDAISWNVKDRNQRLVNSDEAVLYCAKQGEAVLMLGNQWNDTSLSKPAQDNDGSSPVIMPVVHKSPEVSKSQPRVLLTQDIILD